MRAVLSFLILFISINAFADEFWMELKASNKYERTELINKGFDIIAVEEDRVIVLGTASELQKADELGVLLYQYKSNLSPFDFPVQDEKFRNYEEIVNLLNNLANNNPDLIELASIGSSVEGRDILSVRLSAVSSRAKRLMPAAVFMGGHHAREHVSVEMPLMLLEYLIDEYNHQNPRIVSLLNNFEVYIIPVVNPDGKQHDIAGSKYKHWRKNRSQNTDGSRGVDLNRNYAFGWGGAGASSYPGSDTYRGPNAFSEPETQAIKAFVESHPNITTLLSYHTFSQLVLWPWGHVNGEIPNQKDLAVFKTMGEKMAQWNGYRPMKSGDLYLASGDTCDWAYGEHGIFAFTFELDPKSMWNGGFYPGQGVLQAVFDKNLEPALYMIETSDNPYKVLE